MSDEYIELKDLPSHERKEKLKRFMKEVKHNVGYSVDTMKKIFAQPQPNTVVIKPVQQHKKIQQHNKDFDNAVKRLI